MDNLVEVLSNLISEYYRSSTTEFALDDKPGEKKCRTLFSGLNLSLWTKIHIKLGNSINSYLVRRANEKPDEKARTVSVQALTSLREDSFVVFVPPGVGEVQESVKTTIRGKGTSGDWPWVDSENPYFSFSEKVLPKLLERWGIGKVTGEYHVIKELIEKIKLDVRYHNAKEGIFLEEIINRIDANKYSGSVFCNILFMCSIPRCELSEFKQVKSRLAELQKICNTVKSFCTKINFKQDVYDALDEDDEITEIRRQELKQAFNELFLGMVRVPNTQGLLALFRVWDFDNDVHRRYWELLDYKTIIKYLRINLRKPSKHVFNIELVSGAYQSASRKVIITDCTQDLHLRLKFFEDRFSGTIDVLLVNKSLNGIPKQIVKDLEHLDIIIPYNTIKNLDNGKAKKIKVILSDTSGCIKDERVVNIFGYGFQCPFLILREDVKDQVFTPEKSKDDSNRNVVKVSNDGNTEDLKIFSDDISLIELERGSGEENLLTKGQFWVLEEPIDPAAKPGFLEELSIQQMLANGSTRNCYSLHLNFECEVKLKGDYCIEHFLKNVVADNKKSKFEACKNHFIEKLDNTPEKFLTFSKDFEARENLARYFEQSQLAYKGLGLENRLSTCEIEIFEDLTKVYYNSRKLLINFYKNKSPANLKRPLCISFPIYIRNYEKEIIALTNAYLDAYCDLVSIAKEASSLGSGLSNGLISHLLHLDCYTDEKISTDVFLIGPWHPLVIARRFHVQKSYLEFGEYALGVESKGLGFHKYINLISSLPSFRWLPHKQEYTISSSYILMTDDPSWFVGIKNWKKNSEDFRLLPEEFGLTCEFYPENQSFVSPAILRKYFYAHPTNRSISCYVPGTTKSTIGFAEAIKEKLYRDKEKEEPSILGKHLDAGIHIYSDEFNWDGKESKWTDPKVCVYKLISEKDILMDIVVNHDSISLTDGRSEDVFAATGSGELSYLIHPLLESKFETIPSSLLFETSCLDNNEAFNHINLRAAASKIEECASAPKSVGKCFQNDEKTSANWKVYSGAQCDPNIFYQRSQKDNQMLWHYECDIESTFSSNFIVSKIPASLNVIDGNSIFPNGKMAEELVRSLSNLGVVAASKALQGSKGVGEVIGLGAAVWLFSPIDDTDIPKITRDDNNFISAILPVDSIRKFVGDVSGLSNEEETNSLKYCDLIICQLAVPSDGQQNLLLSAIAIECKFSSTTFNDDAGALRQAKNTIERFKKLIFAAREEKKAVLPIRLALLKVLTFGMRLKDSANLLQQKACIEAIIEGHLEWAEPKHDHIVVVTECERKAPSYFAKNKNIIKFCPGHFPVVSESSSLKEFRKVNSDFFSTIFQASKVPYSGNSKKDDKHKEFNSKQAKIFNLHSKKTVDKGKPSLCAGESSSLSKPVVPVVRFIRSSLKESRILLGKNNNSGVDVYWEYGSDELANRHIFIFGKSGFGKSYCIQALLLELQRLGVPAVVIDYSESMTAPKVEKEFRAAKNIREFMIKHSSVTVNPFRPSKITRENYSGVVEVEESAYDVGARISGLFARIFTSLGEIQQDKIAHTIEGLVAEGIADFSTLLERLHDEGQDKIVARLRYISKIFQSTSSEIAWGQLLNKEEPAISIFQLQDISSNYIHVIAELILWDLWNYVLKNHGKDDPVAIVLDEVHNLRLGEDYPIAKIMKEGRKFGLGAILADQELEHYDSDELSRMFNASQQLIFRPPETDARDIARSILNRPDLEAALRNLPKRKCFAHGVSSDGGSNLDDVSITSLPDRGFTC
jgi:hypothetical protein